jgi:hypothetical protein
VGVCADFHEGAGLLAGKDEPRDGPAHVEGEVADLVSKSEERLYRREDPGLGCRRQELGEEIRELLDIRPFCASKHSNPARRSPRLRQSILLLKACMTSLYPVLQGQIAHELRPFFLGLPNVTEPCGGDD